jgi:hypothetical protein
LKTGVQTTSRFERFLTEYALLFSFFFFASRALPCLSLPQAGAPGRISTSSAPEECLDQFYIFTIEIFHRTFYNKFILRAKIKRAPARETPVSKTCGKKGGSRCGLSAKTQRAVPKTVYFQRPRILADGQEPAEPI